jgi:hypothetical protein
MTYTELKSTLVGPVLGFEAFMDHVSDLVSRRATTGPNQTEKLIDFTALNFKRMERIAKTAQIGEGLSAALKASPPMHWVVITEAWCGDSAQNTPYLAAIAALHPNFTFEIIERDQNPTIIDAYLTNGGRSIPKMVAFGNDGSERFVWGPRAAAAQKILLDWKANPNGRTFEDFEKELHTWYAKDKGQSMQSEILELLSGVK